ncbi:hypothetical protein Q5424_18045 [Conexibacter sp. JD483]|uniref:hypothetical protein n=1 Tax=unclassified Conexibacter TaxID=2627773 RepID=UPI00271FA42D|nr:MULTISPECIES: hypothetical protein [unclassified Conexibacter]MDO8188282.1 hypothetical protein [Conexibacter sp. CPCC 205706]MDO8198962.1 hypothetical protein [Conexibacter sp. CPCC 205762]MDR9371004.1 hypothetical protein [Conexibacter sp. JD483]
MVARREKGFTSDLADGVELHCRYEIEHKVVSYANTLVIEVDGRKFTTDLFDCTHGDRNDHHRYGLDGAKQPAVVFHHGTPNEACDTSLRLIKRDFRRMIERWRT